MATDVSIRVGVDGEKEFRSALSGINSQIRNLNSEMNSVVSGFAGMDNAEKKTAQQTEVLGRKMEATKQKISILSAEYDRQKAKLNQLGNELDQLLSAQNRDEAAITRATNAYNRQQTVVNNLGRQLNDAAADMNRMEQEMDDLASGARGTGNALDDAGDKASGFGSKISSGFTVLKGVAANVIANGIQTIASSITSLAGEAVDAADSLTKFESTMSFAGFSTGEINSVSAAMQEYASRTVYDLQTVSNTVAQLGANGVANYEQLTEAAGNLNAVAGGNADTFRSVATVLTQTAGAGKLTTENWNQLADAIPGASGLLQQAMAENGAYVGNFREAMENGEITADEFNQAIMQLGMSDAAQQAAESAETIEGAMGNLKATVVDAITSILTDGGGMNAITTAINGITSVIQFFIENASTIVPILAAIGAALAALQIGSFVASVVGLITQLGGLGAAFTALGGVISAAVTAIGGPIVIIVAAIAGIATAVIGLWNTNETFRTAVIAIWENIKAAFQAAWQFIQSVWAAAQPYFQAIGTAIQTVFMTVTSVISSVFSTAYNAVVSIWNAAAGFFQGVWNGIRNAFSSVQSFFSNAFTSAKNAVQSAWSGISSFFSGKWSEIKGVFSDVRSAFSSIGSNIVNGIKSGVANAWGKFTGWIGDKVDGLVGTVEGLLGIASPSKVFAEIGAFMVEGMAVGLKKGFPEVLNTADKLNEKLIEEEEKLNKQLEDMELKAARDEEAAKLAEHEKAIKEKYAELAKAEGNGKQKVLDEIAKLESDWNAEQLEKQKKAEKEKLEAQVKTLKDFKKEYQSALDEIEKSQDSMADKLKGYGDLLETVKTKTGSYLELGDLEEDINAIQRYGDALEQLKARGVSDSLMDEIIGMSVDDATAYTEKLLGMTDDQYSEYIKLWEEKQAEAQKIAEKFYSDEMDALKKEFVDKIPEELGEVKEGMRSVGVDSIQGMIDGMYSKSGVLWSAASSIVSSAISAMRMAADIHSPSKKVAEMVGIPMGEGVAVGMMQGIKDSRAAIDAAIMQPISRVSPDDMYNAAAATVNGMAATNAAMSMQTIVIPVNLNGKQIAEVIYDPLRQVGKQRGVAFG